jgi:hypothetical protein
VRVDAKGHAKGALVEKPVQAAQTPLEPQL